MVGYLFGLIVLVHAGIGSWAIKVDMGILSKIYLPYTYSPEPQYAPDKDAAEQMAYDYDTYLLYSVGHNNIHVVNISDVSDLQVLFHSSRDAVDATDVEICGEYVFVANDNLTKRENGFVDVYRKYNHETKAMELVQTITVGDLPDMIHPTKDCSRLVVALEAEPYDDDVNMTLVDNPGAVVIVTFSDTPADTYTIKTLDFTAYDSRVSELEKSGVRQVYSGNNNPFSNDVEPEYIAFNEEETKAYITLQENNAIAVVDMENERIENVFGLGFKDWSDKLIDVSDKDGGLHLRPWSIVGMYQPDSLAVYRHKGVDYVITANEGDSKDYKYFSEEVRVADVGLSELFESNATKREELEKKENLGRLKVTNVNGLNATTGKFDRLYAYGGRGFSIYRADTMKQVYDSGSEISNKMSLLHPGLFNNHLVDNEVAASTMDDRSDDKGSETESIAMGSVGDHTLLFIGNERPGVVAAYSISHNSALIKPVFQNMLADIPRTNDTWLNLYNDHAISMIDCEDMKFVPASKSPNGQHLLIVTGSVSGSITIVQVNVDDIEDPGNNNPNGAVPTATFSQGTLLLCLLATVRNAFARLAGPH